MNDIQIAQAAKLKPITEIAKKYNIPEDAFDDLWPKHRQSEPRQITGSSTKRLDIGQRDHADYSG